ncbi:LANO_0G07888g1_1 [Lachancea nothofagi CBS 11611]|uniref:Phosphatidylinositol 3-kinase VPS34 n=1 Tax=Lachancea nothofagi CBS 11611 TaxID=1266666 RepID=A0A1G4KHL1_9SACH|nr:LANO_0G07888g1_1 [Lachancea nothofagi CBS 11611]
MSIKSVTFCLSNEVGLPLQIKIDSLEGSKPLLRASQRLIQPSLSQKLSDVVPFSDMFVSVQVFDKERCRNLTIPVYTPYVPFKNARKWDVWLTLPITLEQLTLHSMLKIVLWEFDGDQEVEFFSVETPLFDEKSCTLKRSTESIRFQYDDPDSCKIENSELQDLVNKYKQGEVKPVKWLDSATFPQLEKLNKKRKLPQGSFILNIEYPLFELPVVYSEKQSDKAQKSIPTFHNFDLNNDVQISRQEPQAKISLGSAADSTIKFYDPDQFNADPIEEKFRRLERATTNSNFERELKPDAKKRDILNHIISYPPGSDLTAHEKGLVWKYRYYLMNNKKALTKLLQSTNLTEETERREVLELVDSWAEIDIEDAIELLRSAYKNLSLRSYAVNRLKKASDNELELYLLQLVQAVCFESASPLSDKSASEFTIVDVTQSGAAVLPSPKFDQLNGTNSVNSIESTTMGQSSVLISPLAEFLIRRAIINSRLGNFFYWYLKSESEGNQYLVHILDSFVSRLPSNKRTKLENQILFMSMLESFCKEIKNLRDTTPKKLELLLHLISTRLRPFLRATPVELPLDPDFTLTDVASEGCKIFKSSLSPVKILFETQSNQQYSLMFKVGDDLRQDQLVVQIITLMNELLKNENVDLKLTPYKILATGSKEGAIQFIPNDTMANILSKHHGILPFFRTHYPSADHELGVQDWVIDNFVKSCAGYCVITYILGVGDRHLDNLLITPDGHFFHADFGYILGQDPKPFPPLMKLPPQIIESFGGADSQNYNKFRSYCFVAYSILRRNANLILNLFELMKPSDIPDIKIDPDGAMLKVKEKFCLDMSEEEAIIHFQNLINASVNALLPLVIDRLHNLTQYWRT